MTQAMVRVGVDIGGTFTDVALAYAGGLTTCKVLTNYTEPETAILEGIAIAAAQAGVPVSDIGQVIHGTTLVTNALIQRRGAKDQLCERLHVVENVSRPAREGGPVVLRLVVVRIILATT